MKSRCGNREVAMVLIHGKGIKRTETDTTGSEINCKKSGEVFALSIDGWF